MTSSAKIADDNTILRGVVGSELYGTSVGETGDRDEIGVCIEPPSHVIGLEKFEQHVQRDQPDGVRSQPGDLDLTVYSLRKFCSLALNGNPTILQLLYTPDEFLVERTFAGEELQHLAFAFASRRAGSAFLGYMQAQRQRLMGERGQRNVKRPELEEAYGYDTKYAAHIVRLGYQGVDYLTSGQMFFPLPERQRNMILDIRTGKVTYDYVLSLSGKLEDDLKNLLDTSILPEQPNYEAVNEFLVGTYLEHWNRELP